jgi:hypothetical protein
VETFEGCTNADATPRRDKRRIADFIVPENLWERK